MEEDRTLKEKGKEKKKSWDSFRCWLACNDEKLLVSLTLNIAAFAWMVRQFVEWAARHKSGCTEDNAEISDLQEANLFVVVTDNKNGPLFAFVL